MLPWPDLARGQQQRPHSLLMPSDVFLKSGATVSRKNNEEADEVNRKLLYEDCRPQTDFGHFLQGKCQKCLNLTAAHPVVAPPGFFSVFWLDAQDFEIIEARLTDCFDFYLRHSVSCCDFPTFEFDVKNLIVKSDIDEPSVHFLGIITSNKLKIDNLPVFIIKIKIFQCHIDFISYVKDNGAINSGSMVHILQ